MVATDSVCRYTSVDSVSCSTRVRAAGHRLCGYSSSDTCQVHTPTTLAAPLLWPCLGTWDRPCVHHCDLVPIMIPAFRCSVTDDCPKVCTLLCGVGYNSVLHLLEAPVTSSREKSCLSTLLVGQCIAPLQLATSALGYGRGSSSQLPMCPKTFCLPHKRPLVVNGPGFGSTLMLY